jgi:hypothetical protein
MADKDQESAIESEAIQELNRLVTQAREGDESVLPKLQQAMDDCPELWQHFGALANHVETQWVKLVAGSDLAIRESLSRKAQAMRVELEGSSPSCLERLLVDAVITTWLENEYFAIMLAASGDLGTVRQVESLQLRRDAAHKRHLGAIKALAETRKLLRTSPARTPSAGASPKGRVHAAPAATARDTAGSLTIPFQPRRKK